MKRLLVCFLTILMLVSSISICAFAKTQPELSVGNVEAQPGKTILVPVKVSNNTGIWGLEFNVKFDTAIFEVQEIVHNGEVFEKGDFMIGPADFSNGYVRFVISAMNLLTENNTNNGTICYIKLKVSEKAQIYKYPFEIEEVFACKVDAETVAVTSKNGSVNIVKSTSQKPIKVKDAQTIVKAKNNKIIDNYKIEETSVAIENVTDKKGEAVTDKNGQKQTVTKVVEVTQKQAEKDDDMVDLSEKDNAVGSTGNTNVFVIYLVVILFVIGIIVLIVVIVKKNKK